MADDTGSDTTTTTEDTDFDYAKAADSITSNDLGLSGSTTTESVDEGPSLEETAPPATASVDPAAVAAPIEREAPKTWPKEMHPHWQKTPKEVQEYWDTREKQMLDGLGQYKEGATFGKAVATAVTPYLADLRAQNVDVPTAVKFLLDANRQLTSGSQESRQAAYRNLGTRLGLAPNTANTEEAAPVDPHIQALQQQLTQIQSGLTAQQQAAHAEAKGRVSKDVDAFWSDPAHPYADEVAADMVPFIQQGFDLPTAYTKATRANDVTWAKEVARIQTETEAKLKENARLTALPKKQAAGVNVRSRESRHAPTEPLGSLEETIRSTWAEQRSRAH